MNKVRRKKTWLIILKILVSLIIILLVFRKIDLSKTVIYLNKANWLYLILALLSFILSKLISSFRLNKYYQCHGLFLSSALNIKLYLLAMYYSLFIPGIGGDGFKVLWLNTKYQFKAKKSILITLHDRVSGLIALFFYLIIFFYFSKFSIPFKEIYLALIPLSYITYYVLMKYFFKELISVFWATVLQSLLVQFLQVTCILFVIQSMGVESLINEYIFVFLVSSLAFIIPIFGAREAIFILGASYLGLDPELTSAIGLLFYLCVALTSLSGIYYFFRPEKLNVNEGKYIPFTSV